MCAVEGRVGEFVFLGREELFSRRCRERGKLSLVLHSRGEDAYSGPPQHSSIAQEASAEGERADGDPLSGGAGMWQQWALEDEEHEAEDEEMGWGECPED